MAMLGPIVYDKRPTPLLGDFADSESLRLCSPPRLQILRPSTCRRCARRIATACWGGGVSAQGRDARGPPRRDLRTAGAHGAGKTTLIKVLLGVVRRSAGQASLLGHPAGDRRGRIHVGYLPENHRIPRHHTGNSALSYYGSLSGLSLKEIRRRRPALLETVGLAKWGDSSVKKYSKGMLQRLGLAQAMLHEPDLLILDEPTDGVDPLGRSELRRVAAAESAGKTVFLNSHLLQEVELVCDRVAILNHGEVLRPAASPI